MDVRPVDGGVELAVYVQPGARRAGVAIRGDALKVSVTERAIEGRANAAVVAAVAELFGVRASAVQLTRGPRSRAKVLRVAGIDLDEVSAVLQQVNDRC